MSPLYFLVIMILVLIIMLSQVIMLILFSFRVLCKKSSKIKYYEYIQHNCNHFLTFTLIIFYICTAVGDSIHLYQSFKDQKYSLLSSDFDTILVISNSTYLGSMDILYIILIHRVYTIFRDSMYRLSTCILLYFLFLLIAVMGFQILHVTYFAIKFGSNNIQRLWPHIPLTILDFIFHVSLLIVFEYKLRSLILTVQQEAKVQRNSDDSTVSSITFNTKGRKLLKLMNKICVLTVYVVIFNQIFGIMALYIAFNKYQDSDTNDYLEGIAYFIRNGACLINTIVINLSYKVNAKMHYRLCSCCDRCVYKPLKYKIKRDITVTKEY